ncbi:MAG: ParB/RepB/Spo0J family partition protein [Candidatus Symbiothrix sp.]|jgi:ParB family chromosome partitioning protein|nr:ParB/RepB/Spo0J family partition protein [Candidatus Symbiothrix sp.]
MKKKISNKKQAGEEKQQLQTPATVETSKGNPEIIQNIELSMIVCNPYNPRKYRPDEDLRELSKSIANFGIIQPITLRPKDDRYEIVCGERRYRSSLMAELTTIPSIIKSYTDEEAMEITILENLQRKDISPVEEAVSFGRLMELRGYTIEDLVTQFGKSDKYIRSRLQLRNLTDEIADLILQDEITLAMALELARFCPEIQKDVYREHLSEENNSSWKHLSAGEFHSRMEAGYSNDLSKYEFDKTDCNDCPHNSAKFDLFLTGNCGSCQNVGCLQYKQSEYMAAEAAKLVETGPNIGVCVTPHSNASADVVEHLSDIGCDVYEIIPERYPVQPVEPVMESFSSKKAFAEAKQNYMNILQQRDSRISELQALASEGKIQLLVDVSGTKPELCYRTITETVEPESTEKPIEKLRKQDERNKEIAIENAVEDVKQLIKDREVPNSEFQAFEEELLYFLMLSSLRKENYRMFGFENDYLLSAEQKASVLSTLTEEQKTTVRRDFIVRNLSNTAGVCKQSFLLIDFATLHFPEMTAQIKLHHNETFKKRHERIEEKIKVLAPTEKQTFDEAVVVPKETLMLQLPAQRMTEEITEVIAEHVDVPDSITVEDTGMDDIQIYPGLLQMAIIGELPESEEQHFNHILLAEAV